MLGLILRGLSRLPLPAIVRVLIPISLVALVFGPLAAMFAFSSESLPWVITAVVGVLFVILVILHSRLSRNRTI